MKKFLVILAVVAMTCMSSLAIAADVSTNGSIEYLMRSFVNTDLNDATHDNMNRTYTRVRLNIDAKAGDAVNGRIGIENDWDGWGRWEAPQGNAEPRTATSGGLDLREAWIGFRVPGAPVGIKGGHMLLQLGNGWFFRSMKYGSDAWVAFTDIDALHLGIVNIKVAENSTTLADDTDAYAFVATYKLSDKMSAGVNFTNINDRAGKTFTGLYGMAPGSIRNAVMQNLEFHFAGAVGPAKLNAEIDVQMGDATTAAATNNKKKFKGNQIVLQATLPIDALTINATLARGSGATTTGATPDTDFKEYVSLMDKDVHYTLVYEYLVNTAAKQSFQTKNTGFGNTTALSLGAGFNVSKNLMIGADAWWLQATEKVSPYVGAPASAASNDLGMELDVKVNWKMYENLSLNTTGGWFLPGDAYKLSATKDAINSHAIQSVLSFKF